MSDNGDISIKVCGLNSALKKEIKRRELFYPGFALEAVVDNKTTPITNQVVLAYSGDTLVGWALLLKSDLEPVLGVFVSEMYRGQGIGSKLIERLLEVILTEEIQTLAHTSASSIFSRLIPKFNRQMIYYSSIAIK